MRYLIWLLASIVAVVAQTDRFIKEIPPCPLQCTVRHLPASGCSVTDLQCICLAEQLWLDVQTCVIANCTTRDGLTAQKVASEACEWPIRHEGLPVAIVPVVLAAIALVFVVIRIIVRVPVAGFLSSWDDALIVVSWVSGFPLVVLDEFYYKSGIGQDVWRVPFDDIDGLLKLFWAGEIPYLTSTVAVKLALLLFYLRVFPDYRFRQVVKGLIGAVAAFWVAFLFALIFQCNPVEYAWIRWDGEHKGTCINVYAGGFAHAVINMVMDLVILLLPIPSIVRLQRSYSWRQRTHVLIMFSFGLIVTVVSVVRMTALVKFGNTVNPTYDYQGPAIWSTVECQIGIICACLPAAKVFFAKYVPSWFGQTTNGTKTSQSGSSAWPNSENRQSLSTQQGSKTSSRVFVNAYGANRAASPFTELSDLEKGTGVNKPLPLPRLSEESIGRALSTPATTNRDSLPIQGFAR